MRTILVVEDTEDILDLLEMTLSRDGSKVLRAKSSVEALAHWVKEGPRIDVLVTDVNLGEGGSGLDLATKLLQEKSTLKVLAVTGSVSPEIGASLPQIAFLHKPFRWADLPEKINGFFTAAAVTSAAH